MNEENEELKKFTDRPADDLQWVDEYIKTIHPEQPSVNFTQQVMNNLHRASAVTLGLPSRNTMLILVGILVTIGIGIVMLAGGVFNSITSITIRPEILSNDQLQQYIPTIPFNGKLIINIVILMNLALVFIILDRAVLKPWFDRRAKANY